MRNEESADEYSGEWDGPVTVIHEDGGVPVPAEPIILRTTFYRALDMLVPQWPTARLASVRSMLRNLQCSQS